MKRNGVVAAVAGLLGLLVPAGFAQSVISAKAGLIHYVEGKVLLDGRQVEPKFGEYPHIPRQSILQTRAGRAEVLLAPGVFLRVAENSRLRLLSDDITDTRLELIAGTVLIECAEISKGSLLAISFRDALISIREDGLYRIESDPAELRVYAGQALVEAGGQAIAVKKGKALALDGTLLVRKFDVKTGDPFLRWSKRRAETIALANLSSAKALNDAGVRLQRSAWYWNPYFGLFTYIPYRGIWSSPFGWRFYSPREVYVVYEPPRVSARSAWDPSPRWDANLGYRTIRPTPAGGSGTVAASGPPTSASSASTAPIPRETGSAGGRTR